MPIRQVPIEKGNIYHVYNRGVNKARIFYSPRNYDYFLNKLADYLHHNGALLAYCLMPNHFHLLLKIDSEDFVRNALQPFLITFTKAINSDQNRVGPLFQGRFQANLIGNDEYFLDCVKYIHLNPVKAEMVKNPGDWKYSSYQTYMEGNSNTLVDVNEVYKFFSNVSEFRQFSEFGIEDYESVFMKEFD